MEDYLKQYQYFLERCISEFENEFNETAKACYVSEDHYESLKMEIGYRKAQYVSYSGILSLKGVTLFPSNLVSGVNAMVQSHQHHKYYYTKNEFNFTKVVLG